MGRGSRNMWRTTKGAYGGMWYEDCYLSFYPLTRRGQSEKVFIPTNKLKENLISYLKNKNPIPPALLVSAFGIGRHQEVQESENQKSTRDILIETIIALNDKNTPNLNQKLMEWYEYICKERYQDTQHVIAHIDNYPPR